jgi:hypothetical protein
MFDSPLVLSNDESRLVRAVENSEHINFQFHEGREASNAIIRGSVIRAILLGIPMVPGCGEQARIVNLSEIGLHIENATIDGVLDLQDCCDQHGSALRPLAIENCVIRGPIIFQRARLRYLSLRSSKFTQLDGMGAMLEGPLDLSYVSSAEDGIHLPYTGAEGMGLCWVNLARAEIHGEITAEGACFVAPPKRGNYVRFSMTPRYALDLSAATILGHLSIRPSATAVGGISIRHARIEGPVYIDGGRLNAVEDFAFDGSYASIKGHLGLRLYMRNECDSTPLYALGGVRLHGAQIGGDLQITGAVIRAGNAESAIDAQDIRIQGNCFLRAWPGRKNGKEHLFRLITQGRVSLMNARIDGCIDMSGTMLMSSQRSRAALDASGAAIGDYCAFTCRKGKTRGRSHIFPFLSKGYLNLTSVKIAGDLHVNGAIIHGERDNLAINGKNIEIGKDCILSSAIDLYIQAKGDVSHLCSGVFQENEDLVDKSLWARMANGHTIGLDQLRLRTQGGISLVSAKIQGNLEVIDAKLESSNDRYALNVENSTIGGNCIIGLLQAHDKGSKYLIQLAGAHVDHIFRLLLDPKMMPTKPHINASDLTVETLDDSDGSGWGKGRLFLDGFRYRHLKESDRLFKGCWKDRVRWLNLQYSGAAPTVEEYRPDPYEHLTRVYRSCGLYDDARRITSQKLTIERRLISPKILRPILWFFGLCYDYGLSPSRAVITAMVWMLVGWGVFSIADHGLDIPKIELHIPPVMVVNASAVNTEVRSGIDGLKIATPLDSSATTEEVLCRNQIDPKLYAVEVMVPGLSLHQQSSCRISTRADGWSAFWRTTKAFYAGISWIVISLTVLTISGILRRHVEA